MRTRLQFCGGLMMTMSDMRARAHMHPRERGFVEYASVMDVPNHLRGRRALRRGGYRITPGQGARAALRRVRKVDGRVLMDVVLLYDMSECE